VHNSIVGIAIPDQTSYQLAETIAIILTIVAVSIGYGRPRSLLSVDERETIGRTTFPIFIISLWASAFARISICCLLLNITQERVWKIVLWVNIGFQCLAFASLDILQLLQCRPIRANWMFVPDAQCLAASHTWIVVCFFGGGCSSHLAKVRVEMEVLIDLGL
jgi:hypothetical protein